MKKPPKKKRRLQPMVIAICTPLMCRIHQNVQQASEMVFCDATSSLDRFNTSLFAMSTCSSIGGLPLGVFIVSDEEQETIGQGLELLKRVLPVDCFFGNGPARGPSIVMTDDSSAERNALRVAWPDSKLFLCTFHFLQRHWTWLHDGANGIRNEDRKELIASIRSLVLYIYIYAENAMQLVDRYNCLLRSGTAKKYPKFIS